ncbi:MAG: bifunctional diaminohydroxyphosphoribosylaminopyrimidine deaminase/5-amino-6-(5-phosphoribosylamino)uracil reductase RibD, partial [Chloroflexota bacterium]
LHLVDEVVIFIAPKIAGEGIAAVNDLGIQNMQQAVTFQSASFTGVGEDIMFRGLPVWDDS